MRPNLYRAVCIRCALENWVSVISTSQLEESIECKDCRRPIESDRWEFYA